MNRRQLFQLTPLILIPEVPDVRRVYSFIWERETEYERTMRLAREALLKYIGERMGHDVFALPRGWDARLLPEEKTLVVRCRLTPGTLAEPKLS